MEPMIENNEPKPPVKKLLILVIVSFFSVFTIVSSTMLYFVYGYDKIHMGVNINKLNIGKMSKSEAKKLLYSNFTDKTKNSKISLKYNNEKFDIAYSDLNIVYDLDKSINEAYKVGRTGNTFNKIKDVYTTRTKGKILSLSVTFDEEKAKGLINEFYNKTLVDLKNPEVVVEDDKAIIDSGHKGEEINKEATFKNLECIIKQCVGTKNINVKIIEKKKAKIDVNEFYKKIYLEPKNASFSIINNQVKINPHVVGKDVEMTVLTKATADLDAIEDKKQIIQLILNEPKVKTQDLNRDFFKDTLSIFNTQFYTSNANDSNRGVNIKLASSRINGKVLIPGQEFSFNKVVGPRSSEDGYKTAHAYIAGKVVDTTGGGICQVSTTLYNAILLADLEVTSRTNHMFTVGYVPLGRDAAVSYENPDLKFRNNYEWPIKIESWITKENQLFFKILGTNETPNKVVDFRQVYLETLEPSTIYHDDPTLESGKTITTTYGMKGYIVDTYKIIKVNGKVVSDTKMHTSRYNALNTEIKRGTKKT